MIEQLRRLWAEPIPEADCLLIDACGLFCPQPIVLLGQSIRSNPTQSLYQLYSTDPGTGPDLVIWARGWGYTLLAARQHYHSCSAAGQKADAYWIQTDSKV